LLGNVPQAFLHLVQAQLRLGADLFESLTGRNPADLLPKRMPGCGCRPHGSCDIPPPCWMPQPLCDCTSHVCPCAKATIRIVVTNCDPTSRRIVAVSATGSEVKVTPPQAVLGPLERATFEATIGVPDDADKKTLESVIRIRGCREHYFRWTIRVGAVGLDSCHEVEVSDCPDYLHHWYDHFYCPRPCPQISGSPPHG
jgi:hypothetical protein